MADGLNVLTDKEIKLECLRLAVEFAGEYQRSKPLDKAEEFYQWVQNSRRKSKKTSANKDQV
jgi:hypothetical protein